MGRDWRGLLLAHGDYYLPSRRLKEGMGEGSTVWLCPDPRQATLSCLLRADFPFWNHPNLIDPYRESLEEPEASRDF